MQASNHGSTMSLAQYATNGSRSSDLGRNTTGDFCNSFWGLGDDGVNILLARMREAAKTTEALKSFWNERFVDSFVAWATRPTPSRFIDRAAIEEQYAARLAALSKAALGGDETG
jgi:hypothetical protein